MRASGEQFEIAAAGYSAVVTEVGATLRMLRYQDRDLVAGFEADEMMPMFRGAVVAPWPNRIADGRYEFGGEAYQLPLSEPDRRTALHGLVSWSAWRVAAHEKDRVELTHRLYPQTGYPFLLDLTMSYAVDADGLSCELTASNAGDAEAPYGCASHSYLVAGAGRVDDWTLTLGASTYLAVTEDRLLPVGLVDVGGTPYDFRAGRPLRGLYVDHAFTDLERSGSGLASARLLASDGSGVEVVWSKSCGWAQVHTADRPERRFDRAGLAFEPMTCPPDAFNSGQSLVVLKPGDEHRAWWRISAV
jgi:aldose 1-epimerase